VGAALEHGDGGVVLLHTWPAPTADAVPGIIRGLRASGAELVGVDALERLP
jgi:peptidoglycan/xylan/chitin deacetylase (PgdA/CDA1 family)